MDESRASCLGAVIDVQNQLLGWLRDHALPFWDEFGVDRAGGGYYETADEVLPATGLPRRIKVSGETRRGRVVARQIYAFDAGRRLGWRSSQRDPVEHGCEYLFGSLQRTDGLFHTSLDALSLAPAAEFSLYEQAFYLFALARLTGVTAKRYGASAAARACLESLRKGWGRSNGGFEESTPPSLPLKSNPHMHLLEAALEWMQITAERAQDPWIDLARELVGLCLTRFRDPRTGAIREYFDYEWRPMSGDPGRIVEPGHQFEWAWLLFRWSRSLHGSAEERSACRSAAARLVEVGEQWGVDPARGIAVNELWDDMTTKDAAAKLWPQTERVKAWCAMLEEADSAPLVEHAARRLVIAAQSMARYLRKDAPGLWHESCSPDGTWSCEPSKASTFYHVVCAIEVLDRAVNALEERTAHRDADRPHPGFSAPPAKARLS